MSTINHVIYNEYINININKFVSYVKSSTNEGHLTDTLGTRIAHLNRY